MDVQQIVHGLFDTRTIHEASQIVINKNNNIKVYKNKLGAKDINSCRLAPENSVTITIPLHAYEERLRRQQELDEKVARMNIAPF